MPTFYPQLGRHIHINPPTASAPPPYISLNFFLVLDDLSQEQDKWEIWTDLPSIAQDGSERNPGNEWHAERFDVLPLDASFVQREAESHGEAVIMVLGSEELPDQSDCRLYKSFIIDGTINKTYSYTYRRILPDGQIVWLGEAGSNGAIHVSTEGRPTQERHSGSVRKEMGINLDGSSGPSLVNQSDVKSKPIHLGLLSTERSYDDVFYSYITSPISPVPDLHGDYILMAGQNGQEINMDQWENPSPELLTVRNSHLVSLLDMFIAANGTERKEMTNALLSLQPIELAHSVIAFTLGEGAQKRIVIWADRSKIAREIQIECPRSDIQAPCMLFNVQRDIHKWVEPGSKDSAIYLRIAPNLKQSEAWIIGVHEFTPLPDNKRGNTWICAPNGILLHEHSDGKANQPVSAQPDAESMQSSGDIPTLEDTPELVSSEVLPDPATDNLEQAASTEVQTSLSWVQIIGRLILKFWNWIFNVQASVQPREQVVGALDDADDEADDSEICTPPNEETPLIKEPFSASSSYASFLPPTKDAIPEYGFSTAISQLESPMNDKMSQPTGLTYLFPARPPYTFMFGPHHERPLDLVKFMWRSSSSERWTPASSTVSVREDQVCHYVQVETGVDDVGDWQVRVETR